MNKKQNEQLLNKIEGKELQFLNIEISKGHRDGSYNIRIGDIVGSSTMSNFSKEDILKEIEDVMRDLK